MDTAGKKVLIVDDEPKIVEVVQSYLEHYGYKVFTAHDGKTALQAFDVGKPDFVVLDLMLPDMTGEEICRKMRQRSSVPIMMLTAKIDEESILSGLDMGADDYMTKPFSLRQLLARIHAILRRTDGQTPLCNCISFGDDDLTVDFFARSVKKQGAEVTLTPSEFKILSIMMGRPNQVFTREELIESAFGIDYRGFERTIDSYIKNLRSKIETDTKNPHYILTVHGVGYKFGCEYL